MSVKRIPCLTMVALLYIWKKHVYSHVYSLQSI
jgi:hypothetical protein